MCGPENVFKPWKDTLLGSSEWLVTGWETVSLWFSDHTVRLWDVQSGKQVYTLERHTDKSYA